MPHQMPVPPGEVSLVLTKENHFSWLMVLVHSNNAFRSWERNVTGIGHFETKVSLHKLKHNPFFHIPLQSYWLIDKAFSLESQDKIIQRRAVLFESHLLLIMENLLLCSSIAPWHSKTHQLKTRQPRKLSFEVFSHNPEDSSSPHRVQSETWGVP